MAAVVEAEPVDDGAILDQPEHARLGISGLRAWRHCSDLGEAAAHGEHRIGHARVLVEARRDAERIGKVETERRDSELLPRRRGAARVDAGLERLERGLVCVLRLQHEQQRPRGVEQSIEHQRRVSGTSGTPSLPSGKGMTASAAETGSGP